jgi:hypothetical protein
MKRKREENNTTKGKESNKKPKVPLDQQNSSEHLIPSFLQVYKDKNNDASKVLLKAIREQGLVDQLFVNLCKTGMFKFAMTLEVKNIDFPDELSGYTALMYAVGAKNYEAVDNFIKKGANVNKVVGIRPYNSTALKYLASQDFDDNVAKIFKLILHKGGDVTQVSGGMSALGVIYGNDNYDFMNLLLKENVGDKIFCGLPTPEVIASLRESNQTGILKAFKENGIKLPQPEDNTTSSEGMHPWQSEQDEDQVNDDDGILDIKLIGDERYGAEAGES